MDRNRAGSAVLVLAVGGLLALALILPATGPSQAAGPWYVAPGGDDGNDCLSPGTACATMKRVLGEAELGDTNDVAAATHVGEEDSLLPLDEEVILSNGWSVSPTSMHVTHDVGDVTTRTLTISNQGSVELEFEVLEAGTLPVQEDPISWWPGEGDAVDIANGNDGTLQGGTTFAAGKVGQAFSFDGLDDQVNVGNATNLHVSTEEFTILAWVRFDIDDGDDMSIVDKMSGIGLNGDGWRLFRQRDEGMFMFCLGGGGDNGCDHWAPTPPTTVLATTFAQKDVWYHVAGVLGPSDFSIYVNGILEDTKPRPTFTDSNSTDLLIGANAPEGAYLDGLVDEVTLFNRALSEAEVRALYDWEAAAEVPWLSTDPIAGTVPTYGSVPVEITFGAIAMQPGAHNAEIVIMSSDAITPAVSVPVTMTVEPSASMGWVEGTVTDAATGEPLKATIIATGQPYTITTDPGTGTYTLWLNEGSYSLRVTSEGYNTGMLDVQIAAQQGTTRDIALVPSGPSYVYLPCITRDYYHCPDFFDDFSNPASGWEVVDDSYVRTQYLNGEYRILTKQAGYFYLFRAPTCNHDNYAVEVDARWVGTPGSSYGVIVGINNDNSQYLLVDMNTDYQQFRILRRDPSGLTTCVPVTYAPAIRSGTATNHIRVTWDDLMGWVSLSVNGTYLGGCTTTLPGWRWTGAGLVTSPYSGQPTSDARFDNFSIVGLPSSGPGVQGASGGMAGESGMVGPEAWREPAIVDGAW